jgi:glycosyltransferase involved in cell wall biosynthesis
MYSSLQNHHIAIAMPIYNESAGIAETLTSIDLAFRETGAHVVICLQNDVSTDNTLDVVHSLVAHLKLTVDVATNHQNSGHGPTTFAAYQRAVATNASIIMQLDSDGQFESRELPGLCAELVNGVDVVIGVRSNRIDPWFRKFVTQQLRNFLHVRYRGRFPDPNSPVRLYSASLLKDFLRELPKDPIIPNIYLSILAVQKKTKVRYISVSHRERRGGESTGTMWQSSNQWGKIMRLLKFCRTAFKQLLSF